MTAARGRLEALTACLAQVQERGPVPEPTQVIVDPPSLTWRVQGVDDGSVAVLAGLVAAVFGTFPPCPRFFGGGDHDPYNVKATFEGESASGVRLTVTCPAGLAYRAALFHGDALAGDAPPRGGRP